MLLLLQLMLVASDPLTDELRHDIKRLYDSNAMSKAFSARVNTTDVNLLNDGFIGYRLGDILLNPSKYLNDMGQSWTKQFSSDADGTPMITIADMATILWPTSLGANVVNTFRQCNVKLPTLSADRNAVLRAILNLRCPKPTRDRAVIHLRVGDQLEWDKSCREDPHFIRCNEGRLMRPDTLERVAKLVKDRFHTATPEVLFVAGIHRSTTPHDGYNYSTIIQHLRASHALGERYISIVRRAFAAHGFNTTLMSGTPDCDFCKMYTARWLMPTGSAFSRQASLVTMGQVLRVHGTGETAQLTILDAPTVPNVSEAHRRCLVVSEPLSCT